MRTSRAVALTVVVVVAAGAAGSYALVHHRDQVSAAPIDSTTPMPLPTAPTPRDPVLPALDASASRPTPQAVRSLLREPSRAVSSGSHLVGEVIDARTGDRLWAQDAGQPEPPASTTKLLTAAAALRTLGPGYRFATTTRRVGGTVYLVGGGDPTIVRSAASYVSPHYPRPATLASLARRTAVALADHKRVRLRLDTSSWTGPTAAPGWKPSYVTEGDITPPSPLELDEGRIDPRAPEAARTRAPTAQAGAAFAALLRRDGVHVIGRPRLGSARAGVVQLAAVRSPTVAQLVARMLTVSDDDLAEALGRAVARHELVPASFAGAARAVTKTVAAMGISTRGVSLKDTSGLSHLDRIPPRTLVGVLRAAASPAYPQLRPMLAGLPVAGLTGTLAERYLSGPSEKAAGNLRAKTGTLTGVNALAGLIVDRSGRMLIFAFLASQAHSPGLTVPALDRLASVLSRCGCTA